MRQHFRQSSMILSSLYPCHLLIVIRIANTVEQFNAAIQRFKWPRLDYRHYSDSISVGFAPLQAVFVSIHQPTRVSVKSSIKDV